MTIALTVVKLHTNVAMPSQAYPESAGFDISAHQVSANGHPVVRVIPPNCVCLISTGLAIRPMTGHVLLVCSRSGLAAKGIFVANAPGIVDPDYTGEIKVELFNGSQEPHYVKHNDRIAQLLVVPYLSGGVTEVAAFTPTARSERGFGSTGD